MDFPDAAEEFAGLTTSLVVRDGDGGHAPVVVIAQDSDDTTAETAAAEQLTATKRLLAAMILAFKLDPDEINTFAEEI